MHSYYFSQELTPLYGQLKARSFSLQLTTSNFNSPVIFEHGKSISNPMGKGSLEGNKITTCLSTNIIFANSNIVFFVQSRWVVSYPLQGQLWNFHLRRQLRTGRHLTSAPPDSLHTFHTGFCTLELFILSASNKAF